MARLRDDEFIRLRAYSLWMEEGQPEGREAAHWRKARREVDLHASRPDRELDEHRSPQQAGANPKDKP
jgi:hypothetical protein